MSSFDLGYVERLPVLRGFAPDRPGWTLVYESLHKWMQYPMIRYSTDGERLH